MADSIISMLPVGTAPQAADVFPFVQGAVTKQISWAVMTAGSGLGGFGSSYTPAAGGVFYAYNTLLQTAADTNLGLSLNLRGRGAFSLTNPTTTAVGGNARPQGAVDLQVSRTAADQIAGGSYSALSGGYANKIGVGIYGDSAQFSVIGGGLSNTIGASQAVIAGGSLNTISESVNAVISGGGSNTIADSSYGVIAGGTYNTFNYPGSGSAISGGSYNSINCVYGVIPGGTGANTRGVPGTYAWAGYGAGATTYGKRQITQMLTHQDSGSATPVYLTVGNYTDTVNQSLTLLPNSSAYLRIRVLGKGISGAGATGWTITALATKGATVTVFEAAPIAVKEFGTGVTATAVVSLDINGTHDGIRIKIVGVAATTIRWSAHIESLEIAV